MATFPDIRAPHPELFSQQPMKAQLRSGFENGAVQSRAKFTRTAWIITMGWPSSAALSNTEYIMLVDFFEANQGGRFDYTHWLTGEDFELQFMEDTLPEAFPVGSVHWSLTGLKLYGFKV